MKYVLALTLVLTACGSYGPYSFWRNGTGYSDTRLAENRWQVVYRGNGLTDPVRVIDFTLLRAAELSVNHGYKYFVLSAAVDASKRTAFVVHTPPTATTSAVATCTGSNTVSCSGSAVTTYNHVPPSVYRIVQPALGIVIEGSHYPSAEAYDAELLYRSLKEKYRLK